MVNSQTKTETRTSWHHGIIVILILVSFGTITYTVTVTRELTASIANLRKEMEDGKAKFHRIFDKRILLLERNCAQQRPNIFYGNERGIIEKMIKKRGIRSISEDTDVWKMVQSITSRSNNTLIIPVLLGGGIRIAGPRGKPGPKGKSGPRGKSGPIGPKGMKGDRGMSGLQGKKGDQGDLGVKGAKGERGMKGAKGDSIEKPRILVPPLDQTVLEYNTATFICEGVGNPRPLIKLMPNNKTMDGKYRRIGEGMLEIINVTKEDEGDIICIVKSALGEKRKTARLNVLVKANAEILEDNVEGEEGYDIAIACKVKGTPLPTVKWRRIATTLPSNVEHDRKTNTLVIKKAIRGDGGKYVCNAENYLRNSTDVVNVKIRRKLSFLFKTPSNIESLKHENISLYCLYENGVGPINETWLKDDKLIQNTAVLTKKSGVLSIPNIDKDDEGSYRCTVQSKYSTLRHVTKVFVAIPKTCNDIRKIGRRASKRYTIYPLDKTPAVVYCDMTSKKYTGVTVISHDSEARTIVNGKEEAGGYGKIIRYSVPMPLIKAIIAVSSSCEQYIKYECRGSLIFSGSASYAWWVTPSRKIMRNWGGVDHTRTGCSCSLTGSCSTKQKCNCDANDDVWREDSGVLNEKEYLPISEVRFGDTGHSSEQGYHIIGKLRCY